MLVLTRRLGESIFIGDQIRIKVVAVGRDRIRLGIEAPVGVRVDRREVYERLLAEGGLNSTEPAEWVGGDTAPTMADEVKGKVKSVDDTKNQFVMTDAAGKDITIHLNRHGKVFINDKAAKLSDLQAGDEVTTTCEVRNEQHHASEVRAIGKNK